MDEIDRSFFDTTDELDLTEAAGSIVPTQQEGALAELKELTKQYSVQYFRRKQLEGELDETMVELGRLQTAIITLFENIGGGMKSVRNELGLFTLAPVTTVSINPELYDEAVKWVEMQGGSRLFKKSAHWKALSSFVQNQMKETDEKPPECFVVNEVKMIRFTPKKNGE